MSAEQSRGVRHRFKQSVDEHPLVYYFGTFLAGLGLATSAIWPILENQERSATSKLEAELATQKQEYEAKVSELEQSLSTLPIQVGDEIKKVDVAKMQISQAEASSVNPRTKFFSEDSVYALPSSGEWRLTASTEVQLLADLSGVSNEKAVEQSAKEFGLDNQQVEELLTEFPLHLWKSGPLYHLEGTTGLRALQPQLILQRVPLGDSSADGFGSGVSSLEDYFRGDEVGQVLSSQLVFLLSLNDEHVSTTLSSVEKAGNAFYARFDTTFLDVQVNGKTHRQFFWSNEVIAITTPTDLYFVKASIPSSEPTSNSAASFVKQWLGAFRIVTTE